jgi:hypothetical protein
LKNEPDFFEFIDFPFSSGVALIRLLKKKHGNPSLGH